MPTNLDFGRVEGMMLGLAIGDALGNASESQLPERRRERYGEIRDYLPNRYADCRRVGVPSDDTQLAFWTWSRCSPMAGLSQSTWPTASARVGFSHRWQCAGIQGQHGIGCALAPGRPQVGRKRRPDAKCTDADPPPALRNHRPLGRHGALGNDHARRLGVHLGVPGFREHAMATAANDCPAQPEWWMDSYVAAARDLEQDESYRSSAPGHEDYEGTLWRFVQEQVSEAYRRRTPTVDACNGWHSGAYLLETMPSVLYILMRYGHDPAETIVRAVNDTWDNDTIAAIVGAAVGALHGRAELPMRWIEGLSGRTAEHDDGRVLQLSQRPEPCGGQPRKSERFEVHRQGAGRT